MLHPIDILDAGTGALLDTLIDPNLQLINPVNVPHPFLDVIVTGSSGNLYCWRPEVRANTELLPLTTLTARNLVSGPHPVCPTHCRECCQLPTPFSR